MHYLNVCGVATFVIALAAAAPNAVAQENSLKYTCQDVGNFALEPLGDREGHAISVGQFSCRAVSGPMSGALLTGSIIWEWDKTNAVLVSGSGVVRKPGATAVYQDQEGKLALTMADGKVTGFIATGRVSYRVGAGEAAALAGKSFAFTAKSTGPGQYEIEDKAE